LGFFKDNVTAITFGANVSVAANDFAVLVRERGAFLRLYSVPSAKVLSGLLFSLPSNTTLPNGGAVLTLLSGEGTIVSTVEYNDRGEWPTVADGGGPSLELRCPTANERLASNWMASPVALNSDAHQETTGTPGLPNTFVTCPAKTPIKPAVFITEIFYHPVGGEGFREATEFFEIHNAGPTPVNIGNWRAVGDKGLLRFTVPGASVTLPAGGFAVFVADLAKFQTLFNRTLPASTVVLASYDGELANSGEKLSLLDDNGFEVDAVIYDDKFPWPLVADALGVDNGYIELVGDPLPFVDWSNQTYRQLVASGGGFSLQRRSLAVGSSGDHIVRWTAALATPGVLTASFGAQGNNASSYIPVVSSRKAMATATRLPPRQDQDVTIEIDFLPKPSQLASPLNYTSVRVAYVVDDPVFGDIVTGGTGLRSSVVNITLNAASFAILNDMAIDQVDYLLSTATPPAKGRADITFTGTTGLYAVYLWIVAENDGQAKYDVYFNNVLLATLTAALGDTGITADPKYIQLVSASRMLTNGQKFQVDSLQADGARGRFRGIIVTPLGMAPMSMMGDGLTRVTCTPVPAQEARFACPVPGRGEQKIVRYRIEYVMSNSATVHLSPRPSDPMRYHGYFHEPNPQPGQSDSFYFYIRPDRWQYLQTTAEAGRCIGCAMNPTWGAEVPGVLVYQGEVLDLTARFQGSRWNRRNGQTLTASGYTYNNTNYAPPAGNFRASSWRFNFPPYATQFGGDTVVLQKMLQGCTMYQTALGYELFKRAGHEVSDWRFVRTYVNYRYFRYQIHVSHGSSAFINKVNDVINSRCIDRPRETVGALYKAQGFAGTECPYGPGSFEPLSDIVSADPACNFTSIVRFTKSIGRKTARLVDPQQSHGDMKRLIDQMNALKTSTEAEQATCRAFLEANFDTDRVLTWIAMQNFATPWDDNLHNWFPYRRATDGKWMMFPWDQDRMFGEAHGWSADRTIYQGDNLDPETPQKPWFNRVKHFHISCFKARLNQKFLLLLNTVHTNASTFDAFTYVVSQFNESEAAASFGGFSQNLASCRSAIFGYLAARPARILAKLPAGLTPERTQLIPDDYCWHTPRLSMPRPANRYVSLPGRPMRLSVALAGNGEISLTWLPPNPNGNVLLTYSIERATGASGGTFAAVGSLPHSSVQAPLFTDAGVADATTYRYRVRVLGNSTVSRFSPYSDALTITTPPAGASNRVPVVINELRANSGTAIDFLELANPLEIEADISGWRILDDRDAYEAFVSRGVPLPASVGVFVVPLGTKIAAAGFRVFDEATLGFALRGGGGEVFLVRALPQLTPFVPTGYVHGFEYAASAVGSSLGRVVLSTGADELVPLLSVTPAAENAAPRVGPVVIAEVAYKRPGTATQFVVLQNVGAAPVPLFNATHNVTWGIGGLGSYVLPTGITLAPGAKLYVSNVNASVLRAELGLAAAVAVASVPFSGTLRATGEKVTVRVPSIDTTRVPAQIVLAETEWLEFQSVAPWPTAPATGAATLVRFAPTAKDAAFALAQDPANWGTAAPVCAVSCKNGGACVRKDTCDCTETGWDGATCDAAPRSCGDGTLQPTEECDGGGCCTANCKFRSAGFECRKAAGTCDVAEVCAGGQGECPADQLVAAGFVCRAKNGVCDLDETCTGTNAACPNDAFAVSSVVCRAAASTCDAVEFCPGTGKDCPSDRKAPTTQVCRASAGPCDVTETCDGATDECPRDALQPATLVCRASSGPCDVPELCTGTLAACPANLFAPNTLVCRNSTGPCDLAVRCLGTAAQCPPVAYVPTTTVCRPKNASILCDAEERCNGASSACPSDLGQAVGTPCVSTDICVGNATCTASITCIGLRSQCTCDTDSDCNTGNPCAVSRCVTLMAPLRGRRCESTPAQDMQVCRPSAGPCDEAERCTGTSLACPTDRFNTGLMCRAATGACGSNTTCSGASAQCPAEVFKPATTVCRPKSTTVCDAEERCTGASSACPPDGAEQVGSTCVPADASCVTGAKCAGLGVCKGQRAPSCLCTSNADCDDANPCSDETCSNGACVYTPAATMAVCRPSVGPCDLPELCTGSSTSCPNDLFSSTFVCRNATDACDLPTTCSGTSPLCPPQQFKPSTVVCRAKSSVLCDGAERCTGTDAACPPDGAEPVGTACLASDICMANATCTGVGACVGPRSGCQCSSDAECNDSNPCSIDQCVTLVPPLSGRKCIYTPAQDAQVCRAAAGFCDEPERCDGARITCPVDRFKTGLLCRDAVGVCDVAEVCDGTSSVCPRDLFAGNETICRGAKALCDAPDRCDGGSVTCGPDLNQPFGAVCRAVAAPCDAAETCDGVTDVCPPDGQKVDGSTCDDLDECTLQTVCQAGVCSGARSACNCKVDADCDDRNDCTDDTCVGLACTFTFGAANSSCSDFDACTIGDKCNTGGRCEGRSFCENGSKCIKPGPFCECQEGFTGLRCELLRCTPACNNGGLCRADNTCECPLNTKGERCEEVLAAPTKRPVVNFNDINVKNWDISSAEFWTQELGGGLYGWSVAAIFFSFILLCILSLVAVGCLLKHFIVDPIDKEVLQDTL
jgi:hypothetical protein